MTCHLNCSLAWSEFGFWRLFTLFLCSHVTLLVDGINSLLLCLCIWGSEHFSYLGTVLLWIQQVVNRVLFICFPVDGSIEQVIVFSSLHWPSVKACDGSKVVKINAYVLSVGDATSKGLTSGPGHLPHGPGECGRWWRTRSANSQHCLLVTNGCWPCCIVWGVSARELGWVDNLGKYNILQLCFLDSKGCHFYCDDWMSFLLWCSRHLSCLYWDLLPCGGEREQPYLRNTLLHLVHPRPWSEGSDQPLHQDCTHHSAPGATAHLSSQPAPLWFAHPHHKLHQWAKLSGMLVCWVGDPLLSYSCLTCCKFKSRNKGVSSIHHLAYSTPSYCLNDNISKINI